MGRVILLMLGAFSSGVVVAEQPNFVVILADDLGWGDLSSYGSNDLRTPNIDRLGAEGVLFRNFYANCTVCSPTRASLLTGRYPELVGVPGVIRTHQQDSWGWLTPSADLLPEVLTRAGYHTAIVGKWHLGLTWPNLPNERGFDYFHGFLGDMMDDYFTHRRHGVNYMRRNGEVIEPEGHATDLFTDWACAYLRERGTLKEPFFLYLAYNAPHTPIQPPTAWLARVKGRETGISEQRAKLVALIEHMDDGIGRVLSTLKQTGLADRTLVLFTSDNGGQVGVGANNGPWRDGKQSMYEGGLRVPFVARWPGRIAPGSVSDWTGISMDVMPTLCEAVGVVVPAATDGYSLLPALVSSEQAVVERDLFFTRREGGTRYGGKTIDAVIRGEWKLLQNSPWEPLQLYHLTSDPGETEDLAGRNSAKFKELSAALRRHIQRGGAVRWQPAPR